MARKSKRIGKLPPRYSFILNPYETERLSRCPKCKQLTHLRKFAFLIHIDGWGLLTLGKTCRYCTPCELIMVHQNELEAELAYYFDRWAPEVIGNDYLVLGTVDKKLWRLVLEGSNIGLEEVLGHTADLKRYLELHVEPGGWYPISEVAKKRRARSAARRDT
jgi:hypothetical protein